MLWTSLFVNIAKMLVSCYFFTVNNKTPQKKITEVNYNIKSFKSSHRVGGFASQLKSELSPCSHPWPSGHLLASNLS